MRTEVLGTIREFRTAHFRVIADAIEDYDMDLSWDEGGSTRAGLESGKYIGFCARVRVIHDTLGEIGCDYLGGCIYESLESFEDHRSAAAESRKVNAKRKRQKKGQVVIGSYFADMVRSSVAEARKNLATAKTIKVRGVQS